MSAHFDLRCKGFNPLTGNTLFYLRQVGSAFETPIVLDFDPSRFGRHDVDKAIYRRITTIEARSQIVLEGDSIMIHGFGSGDSRYPTNIMEIEVDYDPLERYKGS